MRRKDKLKYLVLGAVVSAIISMAFPAMAAMVQKQITVVTGINVYVDDVKLRNSEAFIHDGRTYLPIRAASEALGKEIYWDSKTSTVYLGKHDKGAINPPTALDKQQFDYKEIKLTAAQAYDKYLEVYPNTKVKEIELDDNLNYSYVYKVEGFDGSKEYKAYIHPISGNILDKMEKQDKDNHKSFEKERLGKVEEYVQQALKAEGEGARLDEWSIKVDHGLLILEIEINLKNAKDVEYKYDLEKGVLLGIAR